MIRTLAVNQHMDIQFDLSLERLKESDIKWFWVDFDTPNEEEVSLLESFFSFHLLAIEDCLHFLQRPKLEYYAAYNFFVLNPLNIDNLQIKEIDLFVADQYIVSFHLEPSHEIENAWQKFLENNKSYHEGPAYAAYLIMDKIVDEYFPFVFQTEDRLDELNENEKGYSIRYLMNKLFDLRGDLLKIRRTINGMKNLSYRILDSNHLEDFKEKQLYFNDIYDHLLKLSEMIESNLEITADMRDSYLAINANRMNAIMMLLTIITSIFIPLTFIAGIYGMNFTYMPELEWRYGYFLVLSIMGIIALIMALWFKRRGWFDIDK